MQIWLRVNIVKTLTTQKKVKKMDKKKLQKISSELKKASALHKGQAAKIDKMLKSMKPTKKTKRG